MHWLGNWGCGLTAKAVVILLAWSVYAEQYGSQLSYVAGVKAEVNVAPRLSQRRVVTFWAARRVPSRLSPADGGGIATSPATSG